VEVVPDRNLVRGLDYYTRTCFEYVPKDAGQQGTLLGGGRYDRLVEGLGGPSIPAVGWGMGLERALDASPMTAAPETPVAYILATDAGAFERAFKFAETLRAAGVSCELGMEGKSLKSQMRASDTSGAAWAVFMNPGTAPIGLKNLASHEQVDLAESEVLTRQPPPDRRPDLII
jgi:histidyl-tRNA synthetase